VLGPKPGVGKLKNNKASKVLLGKKTSFESVFKKTEILAHKKKKN